MMNKPQKKKMIILCAVGALGLILVLWGTMGKSEKSAVKTGESYSDASYILELENKICNVIEKITSDRDAAVLITCEGGSEHRYVSQGEGDFVTVRTDGDYSLVLSKDIYPVITGVSVVCRGGDSATVQKKLIDVISTALGISSSRICIVGTK